MSGKGFIAEEPEAECELCGKYDELRPYGPNGERCCFLCAMKDEEAAIRQMQKYIYGREGM